MNQIQKIEELKIEIKNPFVFLLGDVCQHLDRCMRDLGITVPKEMNECIMTMSEPGFYTEWLNNIAVVLCRGEKPEYQCCPICQGFGMIKNVSPFGLATSAASLVNCPTCNGQRIIARPVVEPESKESQEEVMTEILKIQLSYEFAEASFSEVLSKFTITRKPQNP